MSTTPLPPYVITCAPHVLEEPPPVPVLPEGGSWMLLSTTATALSFDKSKLKAQQTVMIYWTWKRTTNTSPYR